MILCLEMVTQITNLSRNILKTTSRMKQSNMNMNNQLCLSSSYLRAIRFFIGIIILFTIIHEEKSEAFAKQEEGEDYKNQQRQLKLQHHHQSKECVLLEEQIQMEDFSSKRKFICVMHHDDSIKVNPNAISSTSSSSSSNGSSSSSLMLKVIGLTDDDIRNNNVISGITTFLSNSAEISNTELRIPSDAIKEFGLINDTNQNEYPDASSSSSISLRNNNNNNNNNRIVTTTNVIRKVLAVRVTATDSIPTYSTTKISNNIFGNDNVNLVTQIDACSYGSMKLIPATGHPNIINGVIDIRINIPTNGNTGAKIREAAITKLKSTIGITDLGSKFDHIMFCLPPGTKGAWLAYAYMNHWLSVYKDRWILYPSAQIHEIGHNLGIQHANDNGKKQGDETGYMGFSYGREDGPEMCYNFGQLWNLGWYRNNDGHKILPNPVQKSWYGKIIGIVDYDNNNNNNNLSNGNTNTVILKLSLGHTDYYIGFNRQSSFMNGVQEAPNEVVIIQQTGSLQSNLQAKLREGNKYIISNYKDTKSDVTIEVKEINLDEANPTPYALLSIYKDNCSPGICSIPSCIPYNDYTIIYDEVFKCCIDNNDCISNEECEIGTCNTNNNICIYDQSNCAGGDNNNNNNIKDFVTIFHDDFENGFGHIFDNNDNGNDGIDATIVNKVSYNGQKSLRIRDDNTISSIAYTKQSYDVTLYTTGRIQFYYRPRKFIIKHNDNFYVEYSSNYGQTWNIIKSFVVGIDFYIKHKEKKWNEAIIDFDVSTINTIMIRFRSNSNEDDRRVFIDDVTLSVQ